MYGYKRKTDIRFNGFLTWGQDCEIARRMELLAIRQGGVGRTEERRLRTQAGSGAGIQARSWGGRLNGRGCQGC